MGREGDRSESENQQSEAAEREPGFLRSHKRETLVLVLLPLLLYGSSLNFDFVLDDKIVIQENRFVQEGIGGIGKILGSETLVGYIGDHPGIVAGSRYRPLSLVSFAVEYALYGLNAARSHLINVLLYAVTCVLVFRLYSVFLREQTDRHWYFRLPFVAALFFAVHPLHSEVVANIKGRDEILALLFALAALLLTFRSIRNRRPAAIALSGLTFLLALLAKENAIAFLAVIPLSIFCFSQEKARSYAIAMTPLAIATAIYLIMRYLAVGSLPWSGGEEVTELMNNPFVEASVGEKYGTIFYTWGLYLKLLIFPHPLTHDYYPYHVPLVGIADPRAILPLTLYLVAAALAILKLRRANVASWSVLYFLATFSIVSNLLFPIGTFMNERFMYMPSVGFCLILAWFLTRRVPSWFGAERSSGRVVAVGAAAAIALGFGLETFARVPDWRDDLSLNRAGVEVSTGSARINCFMGYSLYEIALVEQDPARKQQLLDEAAFYLNRSLEIYPSYRDALNVYAGVLSSRYLLDDEIDALLDGFYQILTINKPPHLDEFLIWLNEQNRHQKELAKFYFEVGYEYYYRELHDAAEAEKYLDFGYRVAPDDLPILEALATFWLERGDAQGTLKARRDAYLALKYAEEGLELDPAHARFREIAAAAHEKLGDSANANRVRSNGTRQSEAPQTNAP